MVPLLDLRASLLTILLGEDNVHSRGGRDEGEGSQRVSRDGKVVYCEGMMLGGEKRARGGRDGVGFI